MSATVAALVLALGCWMLICGWCGYRKRPGLFVVALAAGLALNMLWMMLALAARPFEDNALAAQMALMFYGVGALGIGWLIGRLVRQFRDSRVDGTGV